MEMLCRYRDFRNSLSSRDETDEEAASFDWHLNDHFIRSPVFDDRIARFGEINPDEGEAGNESAAYGSIWLLPASGQLGLGDKQKVYLAQLAEWNWNTFYAQHRGAAFFDTLKFQLRNAGFDDVMIDSRTGLSDIFYTSTLLLADTVFCIGGFNRQSIEGTQRAIETLISPKSTRVYGDKRILLVGSPVPSMRESDIRMREVEIAPEWKNFPGWDALIPYEPHLALREEILAADGDNPFKSRTPYTQAMAELHCLLTSETTQSSFERFTSSKKINPFLAIRVDYWNESQVVTHFIDPGKNIRYQLEQFMPTVIFGSRGTGKTMLARWFDYETIAYRLAKNNQKPGPKTVKQIGLWFRLDIDLLNAFNCDEAGPRENFNRLFTQFFDLLILRKSLRALQHLGGLEIWLDPQHLYLILSKEMRIRPVNDHTEFERQIDHRLGVIRAYINNPSTCDMPFVVQSNILMKVLVEQLHANPNFAEGGHYFAVFIDEYENFHTYQQRIVNTRLKQSKESDRVTYKLLVRNDSIQTYATLASDQPLEDTHDFRRHNLDEGVSFQVFSAHIKEVVGRHLSASDYFTHYSYTDPERLFATQTLDEEVATLVGKRGATPLHNWVRKNHPEAISIPLLTWMGKESSLLRQTVAVVLVNQGKTVDDMVNAFNSDTQKARDWYHNYHIGALYWLYSLYKKEKCYAGFNQIVGIAGNNTRVALDLCYAIVEQWLAKDDTRTLPISPAIQSDAIHAQSEVYFRRLVERGQDIGQIHRFVERIGRLFEIIHKSPRQSEPEINHFKIEGQLEPAVETMLRRCRADAVLRWLPGNKQKSLADERRDAWQLHPRYAPYFSISWRRKKGMLLSAQALQTLFSGNQEEWKALVKKMNPRYRTIKQTGEDTEQRSLL